MHLFEQKISCIYLSMALFNWIRHGVYRCTLSVHTRHIRGSIGENMLVAWTFNNQISRRVSWTGRNLAWGIVSNVNSSSSSFIPVIHFIVMPSTRFVSSLIYSSRKNVYKKWTLDLIKSCSVRRITLSHWKQWLKD